MGTKRFKRQLSLLQTFALSKPQLQKAIIKNSDTEFIRVIIDIIINLLRGNIPGISQVNMKKLNKHKKRLRNISKCSKSKCGVAKARRALLVQQGGFLPIIPLVSTLIPAAISAIGSLFGK